ncbi:brix domain containing protein, putative [Entamoeba invadens IP1]|uniref:Brix domain containing protein, putative n=1 Tax=Entamoeba invadens IP1 TaxID=370355 RepID=A0A0A1U2C6_ENTIV|nr:brix domain containing protein, putative [Entamoeba invadens IP1]ELP88212.1 brix domain containing protein, putative [Entamoeba invadens IP1]|eukprot:XP_004254983.1 brix domain containing protein, putative [Entamoeba invadens IP1]
MLKRAEKEIDGYTPEHEEKKYKAPWSRCLLFGSRGIKAKERYMMADLFGLLPHAKKEAKYDDLRNLKNIASICSDRNCDTCVFIEDRNPDLTYIWMTLAPNGPSLKFFVESSTLMTDLKLSGNCLKGSRPILSFGNEFTQTKEGQVMKEVMSKIFNVQQGYPKSKPFIDHVMQFSIVDDRIWIRNYQIAEQEGKDKLSLVEIGPRLCLRLIKILMGCFQGATAYVNESFVSPKTIRRLERNEEALAAKRKVRDAKALIETKKNISNPKDILDNVFDNAVQIGEDNDVESEEVDDVNKMEEEDAEVSQDDDKKMEEEESSKMEEDE